MAVIYLFFTVGLFTPQNNHKNYLSHFEYEKNWGWERLSNSFQGKETYLQHTLDYRLALCLSSVYVF